MRLPAFRADMVTQAVPVCRTNGSIATAIVVGTVEDFQEGFGRDLLSTCVDPDALAHRLEVTLDPAAKGDRCHRLRFWVDVVEGGGDVRTNAEVEAHHHCIVSLTPVVPSPPDRE